MFELFIKLSSKDFLVIYVWLTCAFSRLQLFDGSRRNELILIEVICNKKIFFHRFPCSRFLAKTLRVNKSALKNIYTYIIAHYNPSVKIIDLVSHCTHLMCVNFIHKWRDLQFKVVSERQIFVRNFFMAILFTLRVLYQKSAESKSPKK